MSKPPAPAPSEWCAKCRHSRPHHEWPDGKCRAAADTDNECCECVEYEAQIPAPAPAPSGPPAIERVKPLACGCFEKDYSMDCPEHGGTHGVTVLHPKQPPAPAPSECGSKTCCEMREEIAALRAEVELWKGRYDARFKDIENIEARADKAEAEVEERLKAIMRENTEYCGCWKRAAAALKEAGE